MYTTHTWKGDHLRDGCSSSSSPIYTYLPTVVGHAHISLQYQSGDTALQWNTLMMVVGSGRLHLYLVGLIKVHSDLLVDEYVS